MVISTLVARYTELHAIGSFSSSVGTCLTSTGSYYFFLIPQLLAFRDWSSTCDSSGKFRFTKLASCLSRYLKMFLINEPLYYLARNGVLYYLFESNPLVPRALSNLCVVGLGIFASAVWLPWLNKKLDKSPNRPANQ